jgi:hypothetical protein
MKWKSICNAHIDSTMHQKCYYFLNTLHSSHTSRYRLTSSLEVGWNGVTSTWCYITLRICCKEKRYPTGFEIERHKKAKNGELSLILILVHLSLETTPLLKTPWLLYSMKQEKFPIPRILSIMQILVSYCVVQI